MSERFNLGGRTLRQHAARGTLVNTAFMVALSFLGLVRGFVLAALLARSDYGLWGMTIVAMSLVSQLQQAGIGDRYVQQEDEDQEAAFQRAFSLSLLLAAVCIACTLVLLPVYALISGEWKMLLPGLVLSLAYLAMPFQMPVWFHYRRMEFVRQRALQAIEPIVGLVVAVSLALAGAGYWALFGGALAGIWATSIVALTQSPYRLRWRYDPGALRSYWSFSAPLMLASAGGLLIAQASVFATEARLGLAGAGALTLAATVAQFTDRVDSLVTGTLYPAIVAVRDRGAVMYESFVKSNRLALMWAVPFGLALTLFAPDLVEFGIGRRWEPALPLLQAFGVIAAIGHIGFNWDAYLRAVGRTRPMAVATWCAAATFLAVGIPLLWLDGLRGLAVGVGAQMLVHVACRAYFLSRLFDGFGFLRHAVRAIVPSLPAVAAVLLMRTIETGPRTAAMAVAEIAVYLGVTAAATWALESRLLREALGYLRAGVPQPTA
jgi:PST family polysaccharide transporter